MNAHFFSFVISSHTGGCAQFRNFPLHFKMTLITHLKLLNPLIPDAYYSDRRDKLVSFQNKLLEDATDDKLADFHSLHIRN